jgi:Ner family transcriptional regulator
MNAPNPADIPTDTRQRREWIKYQLRLRGGSLAQVARDHGVSRDAPILALRRPYPRMEAAIASALGLLPEQIWPERYDEKGRPNRRVGRPSAKSKSISKKKKDRPPKRGASQDVDSKAQD